MDRLAAGPVEGEITFGKDHPVDVVVVHRGIAAPVFQGIGRTGGGGNEYFIRRGDIDGRAVGMGDAHPVQHQLDFVGVVGVHHHPAVLQAAGEDIYPLVGDGDGAALHRNGVAVGFGAGAGEGDMGGALFVVADLLVPVAEQGGGVYPLQIGGSGSGAGGAGGGRTLRRPRAARKAHGSC